MPGGGRGRGASSEWGPASCQDELGQRGGDGDRAWTVVLARGGGGLLCARDAGEDDGAVQARGGGAGGVPGEPVPDDERAPGPEAVQRGEERLGVGLADVAGLG